MKKELFFFITSFFLCSVMIAFFRFHTRQSGEIIEKEEIVKEEDNNEEINYFFNKTSGQITENILLPLGAGILLFFWENDKNIKSLPNCVKNSSCKENLNNVFYGHRDLRGLIGYNFPKGNGLLSKYNWFGLATFVSLIVITFLVEFILQLLIGSISYLFSKDKNKRYFHTLKISIKKREQIFSSLSKKKISFIVLSYLLYALAIVIVAKITPRCCIIIENHHANYCCCFGNVLKKENEKNENFLRLRN